MVDKTNHVSVAIPTYNSSKYLKDCIAPLQNSKFIDEIVINDDFSEIEQFELLENELFQIKKNSKIDIRLSRNDKNYGAFKNKLLSIEKCNNDLVYQIDSDNVPQKNLDLVIKKIIKINDKNNLYSPSKIYHFRKNYKLSKIMSTFSKKYKVRFFNEDYYLDIDDAINYYKNNVNITIDKNVSWILNLGNFFTYRQNYLDTMASSNSISEHPLSADALTTTYFWLSKGGKIYSLNNFYHFHRKRRDSVSNTEGDATGEAYEFYREKYKKS